MYSVFVRYPCMAINDIVQYTPTFFWLPKPLFLYASIVLLSTLLVLSILVTMYCSRYVGLWLLVAVDQFKDWGEAGM